MRLNDPLTTEIEFEGITYPLDLAFDNVLDVLDAISDKSLMAWEKVDLALNLLVGESNLNFAKQMELWELILNRHIQIGSQEKVVYDLEGNPMPTPKSSDDKRVWTWSEMLSTYMPPSVKSALIFLKNKGKCIGKNFKLS